MLVVFSPIFVADTKITSVYNFVSSLSQNVHSVASQYEHLQNLTLADSSPDGNKRIDILVGVDYYYSCIGSEIKRGSENQPLAISSIFGWVLCGCNESQRNVHTNLNFTHVLCLNTENVINSNCFLTAYLGGYTGRICLRSNVYFQHIKNLLQIKKVTYI